MKLQANTEVIALVDCNNFFASCERVFRPDLRNKPVAVLSNNDGCIVARSQEVKDLNIPMAAPYFKYKDVILKNKVKCFSANFSLYGKFSQRVMQALFQYTPNLQVYSIDEAFLSLDHIPKALLASECQKICSTVYKNTGIPISIGVGPSKTLAKLMNNYAKKKTNKSYAIYSDFSSQEINELLDQTIVQEVWGIGGKKSKKLKEFSIYTANQLKQADPHFIRKHFSVITQRTNLELNEISCLQLADLEPKKKNILSSRSFSHPVTSLYKLEQAISSYVATSTRKLRSQKSQANYIRVFLKTSKFQTNPQAQAYKTSSNGYQLPYPTSNTNKITKVARYLIRSIYKPDTRYKKCGIVLSNLQSTSSQPSFFTNFEKHSNESKLFQTIDQLNHIYGDNTIQLASTGVANQSWKMKSNMRSPSYLTSWDDIPVVR